MSWAANLNIASGVTSTSLVAGAETVEGAQYGTIALAAGAATNGATLLNGSILAGGTVTVGNYAMFFDGSVSSDGTLITSNFGKLRNLRAENGAKLDLRYAFLEGSETTFGSDSLIGPVKGISCDNGELTGGLYGGNLFISNGIHAENVNCSNAGNLILMTGAEFNGGVVGANGTLQVRVGGVASGTTVNGGTVLVSANATARDLTVQAGTLNAVGGTINGLNVSGGATATLSGNNMTVTLNNGNVVNGSGGNVVLSTGARMDIKGGALLLNGNVAGTLHISSGGSFAGGTVMAGAAVNGSAFCRIYNMNVADASAKLSLDGGINLGGAETNFDASNLNGTIRNISCSSGALTGNLGNILLVYDGIHAENLSITAGYLAVFSGAAMNSGTVNNGAGLQVRESGGVASGVTLLNGGYVTVSSGALFDGGNVEGGTVSCVQFGRIHNMNVTDSSAKVSLDNIVNLGGAETNFDASNLNGTIRNISCSSGALTGNLGNILWIYDGIHAENLSITAGYLAVFSGAAMNSGTVHNGARLDIRESEASANGATVLKGGQMWVYEGGTANDTIIMSGGSMRMFTGGITDGALTLDLSEATGNTQALVNDFRLITAGTQVTVKLSEWGASNNYTLATTGNAGLNISVTNGSVSATLANGKSIVNPFAKVAYTWNGTSLIGGGHTTTVVDTAAALSSATADNINDSDLSGKWGSATAFTSGNVYLAANMSAGQAWLEIDGYEGSTGTTLYGAQGNSFASGTVNILAKSGSLRNLAAGANAGGTVKAVNLTFAGAELDGTGYAGGFGNVTDEVNTTITTGTFTKDFYAGALANKLATTTSVGDVSMTIDGGTFSGNIFGASAVKTDTTKGNGTRHTAGDVTLTVTGGSTTKGTQACIFAGGYATGDATGTVYTVDSVTATISGGSWGEAAGGRGIFGGIMASGVTAQAGNVNLTISGGSMGNVYGGGWAQKTNGKSIVGDVNLTISGGTITNVFGGGSHSTSGGTTETGDVTITVSGGNITGDIYARGQLDGDTTGAASVIFTGSDGFDCGVYGYSYVGGAGEGAALSFSGYTGEFSGQIGGFDGITLDGATAMTLTAIADDVSNGAWEFDFTDRASTLAGTSLLTWDEGSFENDTIKVSFTDDTQAQGGWNIATVAEAFSGTTFEVEVGGTVVADNLSYSQQIASGDYAGWGFELESGVLKFKNLA